VLSDKTVFTVSATACSEVQDCKFTPLATIMQQSPSLCSVFAFVHCMEVLTKHSICADTEHCVLISFSFEGSDFIIVTGHGIGMKADYK
jgi:hypothetical protein